MGRRKRAGRADTNVERLEALIARAVQANIDGPKMSPWELPTVVACRRVIADTVAQLPLVGLRNGQPMRDQPPVFVRPDPLEPRWLTMHRTIDNLTGYGYVWLLPIAWDATGWPTVVRVVDASRAGPVFGFDGAMIEVRLDGDLYTLGAGEGQVIWIPFEVPYAGSPGQSPIARCWKACEYLAALFEMAGSFWEAGFPSIAVKVLQRLGPGDADNLKAQVLSSWSRRHEPAVIDNGASLEPIGSTAVESQLVESIEWANQEITRAFGVMPSIVNVASGDSLTYSTTEGEFTKWRAIGVGPYLTRLEAAWTDLVPRGITGRFDTINLIKADLATQGQYYNFALAGQPWLTVDEVRLQTANLPPIAEATPARFPSQSDRRLQAV